MSSKKKKKKKNKQSGFSQPVSLKTGNKSAKNPVFDPNKLSVEEAETLMKELISGDKQKQAVELAKAIHAREQSPETEGLLAVAYLQRIEGFLEKNMHSEALGLIDLVRERFPYIQDRLIPLRYSALAINGDLDALVAPLADSELSKAEEAAIFKVIRSQVTDLTALADCSALPLDHSLRQGAENVWRAFEAVTSGPVEYDDITLPGISRKSPLAPWKLLIRAIAQFYKKDDDNCLKSLASIPPDSAPAQLIPVLRGMISGKFDDDIQGSPRVFAERIGGYSNDLFLSLRDLDRALDGASTSRLVKAVKKAILECKRTYPELLDKLKQIISARVLDDRETASRVEAAMGEPAPRNSTFWQILAVEAQSDENPLWANAFWAEFILQAHHEGLFAPNSVEDAVLYLNMAGNAASVDAEMGYEEDQYWIKKEMEDMSIFYTNQPPEISEAASDDKRDPDQFYYLSVNALYARAAASGSPEMAFPLWLNYAERINDNKLFDHVAEEWHKADQTNVIPLIHLAGAAEKRKAYKKALTYVEEAEALDELNPSVRRTRFRLLMANAKRHITQKKTHLLEKDIINLLNASQTSEGDRHILISCLYWADAVLRSDNENEIHYYDEVVSRLGGPVGADILLTSLAQDCGLGKMKRKRPNFDCRSRIEGLLDIMPRLFVLGSEAGIQIDLPRPVNDCLISSLSGESANGTAVQYEILAATAIKLANWNLAYVASGAGLALNSQNEARFLYLRAQSLPQYHYDRQAKCLSAALELAKNQGDKKLINDIIEARRLLPIFLFYEDERVGMSTEDVEKVLTLEKKLRAPEMRIRGREEYEKVFDEEIDPFDDRDSVFDYEAADWEDEDEEDFDDDEFEENQLDFDLPPQLGLFPKNAAQELLEVISRLKQFYPDLDDFPRQEDVIRDYPGLAMEMNRALENYVDEYGKPPDNPAELIMQALGNIGRKSRSKQTRKKKKARRKR